MRRDVVIVVQRILEQFKWMPLYPVGRDHWLKQPRLALERENDE